MLMSGNSENDNAKNVRDTTAPTKYEKAEATKTDAPAEDPTEVAEGEPKNLNAAPEDNDKPKKLHEVRNDKLKKTIKKTTETFNTAIETIPTNIVAGVKSCKERTLFEVVGIERENVSVQF